MRDVEQVRKRGLPPLYHPYQRGQAPLPDLFFYKVVDPSRN